MPKSVKTAKNCQKSSLKLQKVPKSEEKKEEKKRKEKNVNVNFNVQND